MNLRLFTSLLFASFCQSGYAADFSLACDSRIDIAAQGCSIQLRGAIVVGDADRLRKIILKPLQHGWSYRTLLLDSPGGNVLEAMKIADVVRSALLETSTFRLPSDVRTANIESYAYPCVSACFLVWVAGTKRSSLSMEIRGGRKVGIGLHRPFFSAEVYKNSPSKIAESQQAMTVSVRDYLRREQVPEKIIELMLERSSREVFWLFDYEDPNSLDGIAPWFEEMMISRCDYDPAYNRRSEARGVALFQDGKNIQLDATYQNFLEWRQKYNTCEYEARRHSQTSMRQ